MKKRLISGLCFIIFIAALSVAGAVFAQSSTAEISDSNDLTESGRAALTADKDYLMNYMPDTVHIFTSPLRWEKPDWIRASIIAGTAFGLYALDQEIQDWAQDRRDNTSEKIASFFEPFGNGLYILPSLGGAYLYSHFSKDERAGRVALLGLKSFVISGLITDTIKIIGHRHRPNTGNRYDTWDGPGFSTSNLSFPSGHSTSAFSIAAIVASEYEDKAYVPPLAYGIATLTALSRVHDNKHWASDVFVGSVIGYFTGKTVYYLNSQRYGTEFNVLPLIDRDRSLVMVTHRF